MRSSTGRLVVILAQTYITGRENIYNFMVIIHFTHRLAGLNQCYFIDLGHINNAYLQTSSAACLEPRSVSSLWADGAKERQAGWYRNFFRLWA